MHKIFCITFFLVLCGCGGEKNHRTKTTNDISVLVETKNLYLELVKSVQGPSGFIEHDECDSLLFSALVWGAGLSVDIEAARGKNGLWYRTPDHRCYDEKRSGSDTSKDMIMGIMWGAYLRDRSDILKQIYDYGKKKGWIFGRGPVDRTYFLPTFVNTLRILTERDDDYLVDVWIDPVKDHVRHISALNIILRGEAEGNIRDDQLALLKKFAKKSPKNALFHYGVARFTDGDQSKTISILSDTKYFPKNRLPSNIDRKGRWLWERSEASDNWRPSSKPRVHSGGDLIFLVRLLEN